MEEEDILTKQMKIIKEYTDNEILRKMINEIDKEPSNQKTISKNQLKKISYYTYKDYANRKNNKLS